eukprot:3369557-Amphidinium_carterae.1
MPTPIFDVLDLPADFSTGTVAKSIMQEDMQPRVVVFDASLGDDENNYVTAASGADEEGINPLAVLTSPVARRRRPASTSMVAADPRPLGGSAAACSPRPGCLSSVLAPPAAPQASAKRKAQTTAKAQGGAAASKASQPSLKDVLDAVSGLSSRITQLESQKVPVQVANPPMPSSSSMLAPGRFQQSVPAPGKASACAPPPPRVLEAQQLVASLPVPSGVVPEKERMSRERVADATLREAIERGGAEAKTEVQLAMLQALQKISHPRSAEDDLDGLLEGDEFDENVNKITSGAKGAAALMRLHQLIEKNPASWSAKFDRSMYVALGCDHTQMPWSANRYFAERVAFGRHVELERFAHMLCALHALHRTGQHELLGARVSQFLKAVEQTALHNGSWRISWSLTGLPEPRPSGALNQGLSCASELAASVQFLKDAKTIEELVRRETAPPGVAPSSAAASSSVPSGPAPPASNSRRRRGGGKGGPALEPPKNHNRANVASASQRALPCVVLGAYTAQGAGITRATVQGIRSGLVPAVLMLLRTRTNALPFSSVAITHNAQAAPHRDRNNVGPSSIVSFGNFTGGELLQEWPGGNKFLLLPSGERCPARV